MIAGNVKKTSYLNEGRNNRDTHKHNNTQQKDDMIVVVIILYV